MNAHIEAECMLVRKEIKEYRSTIWYIKDQQISYPFSTKVSVETIFSYKKSMVEWALLETRTAWNVGSILFFGTSRETKKATTNCRHEEHVRTWLPASRDGKAKPSFLSFQNMTRIFFKKLVITEFFFGGGGGGRG